MARTNTTDVDEILDTSLSTGALQAYVDAASDVVDDVAAKDSSISSGRLERIEKFYAAHLATAQDPRHSSQSRETASVSNEDRTTNANANYKELAVSLDPTGVVSGAGKPAATLSVPDAKGVND